MDDHHAKGGVETVSAPISKRGISSMPVQKPIRTNAPNSVFALGAMYSAKT
jgi:Rrf2 family iron-sulfur cluster assembly transcriptional regulator